MGAVQIRKVTIFLLKAVVELRVADHMAVKGQLPIVHLFTFLHAQNADLKYPGTFHGTRRDTVL